ncbi:MAG: ECF-type sigma factor [Pirellulales bacterium]
MTKVTNILAQIEQGDPSVADQLLPLIYDELRKLAAARILQERRGQAFQATALVHEAYLRLVDGKEVQHWNSRGHFFGAAAEAMRRILIEDARRNGRIKHGAAMRRVGLDSNCLVTDPPRLDLLELDEALSRLADVEPLKAKLVTLRFFGGLTMTEAANILGVSLSTAERYWLFAKSWLFAELADSSPAPREQNPPE